MSKRTGIVLEGGMGKMILFSSLLPKLKEKYGDIILVNPYPDVFLNNPHVKRNLFMNHPYLYEDYLGNIPVIKREPYVEDVYRLEKKHLIEAYCHCYNIEYSPDMKPQLFITEQELAAAKTYRFNELKRPFILVQVSGGTSFYDPSKSLSRISTSRDYNILKAQRFVDLFTTKFPEVAVIQIRLQTEPALNNCVQLPPLGPRQIFPLLSVCDTFVGLDSFMQHAAAALNKRGVVVWQSTSEKKLGYDLHTNLRCDTPGCDQAPCHRPESMFDIMQGQVWTCPNNLACGEIEPMRILEEVSKIIDKK